MIPSRAVHHLVYRRSWDAAPIACGATREEADGFLALAGVLAKVVLLISTGPAALKPCPICQPDLASRYVVCRDIDNGVLG